MGSTCDFTQMENMKESERIVIGYKTQQPQLSIGYQNIAPVNFMSPKDH